MVTTPLPLRGVIPYTEGAEVDRISRSIRYPVKDMFFPLRSYPPLSVVICGEIALSSIVLALCAQPYAVFPNRYFSSSSSAAWSIPSRIASGLAAQPTTYTSTGSTLSTPPNTL